MVYLIVVLAVLARFVPHIWNFSSVYGAMLFGGAHLKKRDSLWFPVLLLGLSDVVLTKLVYHQNIRWGAELVDLSAFAVFALLGWSLRGRLRVGRFAFACVSGATAFFLISNFGVWLWFGTYAHTWNGLARCYIAAIPYYGYTLSSTFLFGGLLFGIYEFCQRRFGRTETREASTQA